MELGFTSKALATSQNSIFYWKGNTSHPQSAGWRDLIDAFIRHIEERYGRDEVRSWYFEVWNEPNLAGFWEGADENAYFELYDLTSKTIKSIDATLRVGGLLNRDGIRKPAFFAYKYLHALEGDALETTDPQAMLTTRDGNLTALIWDFEQPQQKVSNRSFYTKLVAAHPVAPVRLQVTGLAPRAAYRLEVHRVGYHANDAYSAYLEMGGPKDLSVTQVAHLMDLTRDLPDPKGQLQSRC